MTEDLNPTPDAVDAASKAADGGGTPDATVPGPGSGVTDTAAGQVATVPSVETAPAQPAAAAPAAPAAQPAAAAPAAPPAQPSAAAPAAPPVQPAAAAPAAPPVQPAAAALPARVHLSLGQGLRAAVRAWASTVIGVGLAVLLVSVLVIAGAAADYVNTLGVMGFDPDRAILLASLIGGAIAAATVSLVGGRYWAAVLTGMAAVLAGFYSVFREETRQALRSSGSDGTFDPVGWALSVLTLVVAGVMVGWAATVLGADVRRRALVVLSSGRRIGTSQRRAIDSWRLMRGLAIAAILGVTIPIFGDMLNFEPDAHMRQGAPVGVALFGGNPGAEEAAGATPTAPPAGGLTRSQHPPDTSLVVPPNLVAGPIAGSYVTEGALAVGRPWAAHPPTGGGRTFSVNLPAPWIGGLRDYATIDIYLPPGYDAGAQRYPVIYEPHQPLWAWEQGMHVTSLLDALIRAGDVPPSIVVFVGQYGGPYADSECADSWDGREWFDRYLGVNVPEYVDAHFRTIATVAARALLGFSSGGYCAAAAISHHPDVFGSALIFSGYFEAGIKTTTTPVAGLPFNNDPALEAQVSPIVVVPRLPAAQRRTMFLTFSADPANRFYGDQITTFAAVLDANDVAFSILPTPLGHSWAAVREQLPDVLAILSARQLKLGVFATQ